MTTEINDWDEVASAVGAAVQFLESAPNNGPAGDLSTQILRLIRDRDAQQAFHDVEALEVSLSRLEPFLSEISRAGRRAVQAEIQREPFGQTRMEQIARDLQWLTGEMWIAAWMDAWSDGLAARQWEFCLGIASIDPPAGTEAPAQELRLLTMAVKWLTDGEQTAPTVYALPVLAFLLRRNDIPARTATRLWVLRARISRRQLGEHTEAIQYARRAEATAPPGDRAMSTLACAELAAALLDAGHQDEALELTAGALELESELPDLLITGGRVATALGSSDAQRYYDAAAARFQAEAAEPALLRDRPMTLIWRVARQVARTDREAALALYDLALSDQAEGWDPASERKILIDKAELLELVGRTRAAAECFKEAGSRYAAAGSNRALRLFGRAHNLVPSSAEYAWLLAEEQRMRAHAGPVMDRELLKSSWDLIAQGLKIRPPDRSEAWVLVSAALSDWWLTNNAEATLLIERALLLDPDFARALGHLAELLRRQGYLREALAAAEAARRADPADSFLTGVHVSVLHDLGHTEDAWNVLLERQDPTDAGLAFWTYIVALRTHRVDDAIAAAASDLLVFPRNAFLRGLAYAVNGDREREIDAVQPIWLSRDELAEQDLVAWVAVSLRHWDDAEQRFEQAIERDPVYPGHRFGLALSKLCRHRDADVAEARAVLSELISKTTDAYALIDLIELDLPAAIAVLTETSETDAAAVEATELALARQRLHRLRTRSRPSTSTSARLADARWALQPSAIRGPRRRRWSDHSEFDATRFERAVDIYRGLSAEEVPELALGIDAAVSRWMSLADRTYAADQKEEASRMWISAAASSDLLPQDSATRADLHARVWLDAVRREETDTEIEQQVLITDPAVRDRAIALLVTEVADVWSIRTGLRRIADRSDADPRQRAGLLESLDHMPLARAYRLSGEAVNPAAVYPIPTAISIRITTAHETLVESEAMGDEVRRLRELITADSGIRLPDVHLRFDGSVTPRTAVVFDVFDVPAAALEVSPDDPDRIARIGAGFEAVLRDNLFRWFALDDLELWAAGWDTLDENVDDPELELPGDPGSRLRLYQCLRMLVREHVSILDRALILDAFYVAEQPGPAPPEKTIRAIRRALYPAILGPCPPEKIRSLPTGIEDAFRRGLIPNHKGFGLPRSDVQGLVEQVRSWLAADDVRTVLVGDPRLRPFLWRLLAAERPHVHVVAEDELR